MQTLATHIDPRSEDYESNTRAMQALVEELRTHARRVSAAGGAPACERHTARGKLLPRERVEQLLDPGTPFLELSPLAAHGMYDGEAPGAGHAIAVGVRPPAGR